jgi:hypothetical protein
MAAKRSKPITSVPMPSSAASTTAGSLSIADLGTPKDPIVGYRKTLHDVSKDYPDHDVVIELLQNALDAIDQRRYELICDAANLDAKADATIEKWNGVVRALIEQDYKNFQKAYKMKPWQPTVASLYTQWKDDKRRRIAWWDALAKAFCTTAKKLTAAIDPTVYLPKLTVSYSHSRRVLRVEENGVGMDLSKKETFLGYFRNTEGCKREVTKRLGVRGSHGWGLTSVLTHTNRLHVYSAVSGSTAVGWKLDGFRDFRTGGPEPVPDQICPRDVQAAVAGSCIEKQGPGTIIEVSLSDILDPSDLQHTLDEYTPEKLVSFLRLFSPIAQVNDYVFHPAYHCYRRHDKFDMEFCDLDSSKRLSVDYSLLELRDILPAYSHGYDQFLPKSASLRGQSVHTIFRYRSAKNVHVLSAAEVQQTDCFQSFVDELRNNSSLPIRPDGPHGGSLWRGFYLGLSGGLLCAAEVQGTKGNDGNYRGVALAEEVPPSLARKHISNDLGGNTTIPIAARNHTQLYDDCRKLLKPASGGHTGGALYKKRREYFDELLKELAATPTTTSGIFTWAPGSSGEARVMLVFAELMSKKMFGDFRVLKCGLRDTYDFAFIYNTTISGTSVPGSIIASELESQGRCDYQKTGPKAGRFLRLGIGEFKADGVSILDDSKRLDPLKNADAIDVLVCWHFDDKSLEVAGWDSERLSSDSEREFPMQTHRWTSQPGADVERDTNLAVISLEEVIKDLVASSKLTALVPLTGVSNHY